MGQPCGSLWTWVPPPVFVLPASLTLRKQSHRVGPSFAQLFRLATLLLSFFNSVTFNKSFHRSVCLLMMDARSPTGHLTLGTRHVELAFPFPASKPLPHKSLN